MGPAEIRVEVVFAAGPHQVDLRQLSLPQGATAADALRASGLAAGWPAEQLDALRLGCWGRVCDPGLVLRDRDRIELYRPLQVDPKEARRLRYRRDGIRKKVKPPRR